jgi:predicted enzyme related to lactoylglutathione lyase
MGKAVGVGGVFLKARDPKALSQWYETHLGLGGRVSDDALVFDGPTSMGMTVFGLFPTNTEYFGAGPQQFMMNFRVDDLDALLGQLGAAGVRIDAKREDHSFGRFAWIWDPEENRVELWQPAPEA